MKKNAIKNEIINLESDIEIPELEILYVNIYKNIHNALSGISFVEKDLSILADKIKVLKDKTQPREEF